MPRKKATGPRWFKVFIHNKDVLSVLPPDAVGSGLLAALDYLVNRSPPTELNQLSTVAFNVFKSAVDECWSDYSEAVANGYKAHENDETNPDRYRDPVPPCTTLTKANPRIPTDTEDRSQMSDTEDRCKMSDTENRCKMSDTEEEVNLYPNPIHRESQNIPTLEDAREYINERINENEEGWLLDSLKETDKFMDYYTSTGWIVNGYPVRDWKALARNWVRRAFEHIEHNDKDKNEDDNPLSKAKWY